MRSNRKSTTLGQLVSIQSGVSPSAVTLVDDGPLPFVKVDDLNNCLKYQEDAREYTTSTQFAVPTGSILFAKRGAAIMVNKVRVSRRPLVMDTNMMALIPDPTKIDAEYLFYFIQAEKLSRITDVSSIPQINNKHINPYPILVPTLAEQRKIAEVLRTWDESIEACERLIAAKKLRIAATYRQFFDPCHPKHESHPAAWRMFALGQVFQERDEAGADGEKLLSITMSEGVIDREEVGRKDTSNNDKSSYKLILPGDIGYNTMRMWQGVSGLSQLRGIVSPAYTVITPDNRNIDARYATHLFKSRRMVFDFQRYSQGLTSDTWNLKFPVFSEIEVYLPPFELQQRQASLLETFNTEVALIEKQRDAIAKQKRGLMRKLLTGEWRVREGAQEVAA